MTTRVPAFRIQASRVCSVDGKDMPQAILCVSASGVVGGAERSLVELVRALDRRLFDPVVAIPGPGPLHTMLASAGVEVFQLPSARFQRTRCPLRLAGMGARWAVASVKLARLARRLGADLIHSNGTTAHLIGGPAAALIHVPCVWHVRDLHKLGCLPRLLAPFTQGVVFVSNAVRQSVRLPADAPAIARTIPNAIDADAFERSAQPGALRRELDLAPGCPLVLMAAQMVPWKGHETFIRAVALLKERRPGLAAAIAGADPYGEQEQYARSLHEVVRELGLERTVHFLGHRDDVASLMADSDVVVVPSHGEPFGRVALEAMAVGRPVVGTEGGGLSEVVADGETGLIVPQGDPVAMAAAVEGILGNPEMSRSMCEAGRLHVRERFAVADHAREIERLYRDVIGSGRLSLAR